MKNKKLIFAILVGVFTIVFALLAIFVIPIRKYTFPLNKDKMNIVIVGDSTFCNDLDGKNLSECLANKVDADIYNYSIGGTTAARLNFDGEIDYYLDKFNFYNVSDIMITGNKATVLDNARSVIFVNEQAVTNMERLAATDLSKCQILIINYGINDYLSKVSVKSDIKNDEGTFAGALRKGIAEINGKYPDLKIIVNTVPYVHIENEKGNVKTDSKEDGIVDKYNEEIQKIAEEFDNVYCFDMEDELEINAGNYDEYHVDLVHFNEKAKEIIADSLAEFIGGLK